jgi:cytochrome P450
MPYTTQTRPWPVPLDDPYPELRRLRETAPIHYFEELGSHVVFSHELVTQLLRGEEWSSNPALNPRLAGFLPADDADNDLHMKTVLFTEGPPHTRLRRSVSRWLSPRTTERYRAHVESVVETILADDRDREAFEVMENLAYVVPQALICEILDVPVELVATRLRQDIPGMLAVLDPLSERGAIEEGMVAGVRLLVEVLPLVAERRANPRPGDLISTLVEGESGEGGLSADEATMMALLLLAAGHETTATLIGNAVIALHENPDVARSLRAHPEQIPGAIEELLRFESPVQVSMRVAKEDVTLGPFLVRKGEEVLLSLGAANRDPGTFPDPDRVDVSRNSRLHVSFGLGAHFCVGAALARIEAQVVLRRLLELSPLIEERGLEYTRGSSATLRGIDALWLRR